MSTPRNRQPAGAPTGGQFSTTSKGSSGLDLDLDDTPAHQIPIELPSSGDETYFDGDGELVQQYRVAKTDDGTYEASADMFYMRLNHLTGAEELDDDDAEDFIGPGSARGRFAIGTLQRHFGTEVTEQGDEGDDIQFAPVAEFDGAPTEEDVVNKLWPDVARIANETDPGTFGVPYVGNKVKDELDRHAFLEPEWEYTDGTVERGGMTSQEGTRDEVVASQQTGRVISDGAARTLAQGLALAGQGRAYTDLHNTGAANREELLAAAGQVAGSDRMKESARALSHWGQAQEPTSLQIGRLEREARGTA